jgi:hypothetical protein
MKTYGGFRTNIHLLYFGTRSIRIKFLPLLSQVIIRVDPHENQDDVEKYLSLSLIEIRHIGRGYIG